MRTCKPKHIAVPSLGIDGDNNPKEGADERPSDKTEEP